MMTATENPSGLSAGGRDGGWQGRMFAAAREHGYHWPAPQLHRVLSSVVERHGEELVERAWRWWVANVHRLEQGPKWVNPKRFASMVGYYIHMSKPASGE